MKEIEFNMLTEPWVRVRRPDNTVQEVSLTDALLHAQDYVDLAAEEYTAVLENLELLADCGFLCEDFGDGTVLVREVPDDVRAEDAAATLEELAQKLRLHSADRAALRDEVLHTVACKSAIKAGMTSDPAELRALAAQVQSGAVRYCPHGRPVAVKLREYEIEKMFKRA